MTRSLTQPPRDPHFTYFIFVITYIKLLPLYDKEISYVIHCRPPFMLTLIRSKTMKNIYTTGTSLMIATALGKGFNTYVAWSWFGVRITVRLWYTTLPRSNLFPYAIQNTNTGSTYLGTTYPLGNEYKVVGLTKVTEHQTFCQVFTMGDPKKLWTSIQCGIGLHFNSIRTSGLHQRGNLLQSKDKKWEFCFGEFGCEVLGI